MPGEYQLTHGAGRILVQNIGDKYLVIEKGNLITRSHTLTESLNIHKFDFSDQSSIDESPISCGENLTKYQKESLKALLDKYKYCFSSSLKDLGFTTASEL